ncbi:hypothetical protein GPJ56_008888 [Histomonas meleagridis]|uniref:uncharacterized protein n=1 Tax=Histomonas meleagridis TaxID=135588 RepID=UPI00355AC215|nr:hypothetical protein GPJ56_008888 [Histomonas meleagridis]KAH0797814.1 hypothetical protein GO595_009443 [Histomonas meleagridis]
MAEQLPLPILAPFIQKYDTKSHTLSVSIPNEINERLKNPEFTTNQFPDYVPAKVNLHLIPTSSVESGKEITIDDLIKKQFDNQSWQNQVQKAMAESGLIQDKTKWVDEQITTVNPFIYHDDLFTVRVDNLPDGVDKYKLEEFLKENGCNYFVRVIVPRDEVGFKRFGFVKFDRLRYAIIFMEKYQHTRFGEMLLSIGLIA